MRDSPAPAPAPAPARATARLQALDGARALFVLLGLVLHAAGPYLTTSTWLIHDAQSSVALTALHAWIHAFRMPGFFLIAGVLSAIAYRRTSRGAFLRRRARRLGIPFLLSLCTLAVFEQWLVDRARLQLCGLQSACAALGEHQFVTHLWFLPMLMLVTVLVALAPREFYARMHDAIARVARRARGISHPYAIASVATLVWFAWAVLMLVAGRLPGAWHAHAGFLTLPGLLEALFFYAAGVLLAGFPPALDWLQRRVPAGTIAVLFAIGLLALAVSKMVAWPAPLAGRLALVFAGCAGTVLLLQSAVHASLHAYDRWSAAVAFASKHAYGVYLLHHSVVVACALALLPLAIGALAKFLVVLCTSTIVSFGGSMLYASAKERVALIRASAHAPSAT